MGERNATSAHWLGVAAPGLKNPAIQQRGFTGTFEIVAAARPGVVAEKRGPASATASYSVSVFVVRNSDTRALSRGGQRRL
jgi:hypothetical protein